MLSYRHSFHAGNHADMLKHSVLFLCARYMLQKNKPFVYIDTHAGAGMYRLSGAHARKNAEFEEGLSLLRAGQQAAGPDLQDFLAELDLLTAGDRNLYPGSPGWMKHLFADNGYRMLCHELHPRDYEQLSELFRRRRKTRVLATDGFQGLIAAVPPPEKRALVLIDPPYEQKQDYNRVTEVLDAALKRFAQGVYLLWYPVVDSRRMHQLDQRLKRLGSPLLQMELHVAPASAGRGMTGSGMAVINPPYYLQQQAQGLLDKLKDQLAPEQGHTRLLSHHLS